MTRWKSAPDMSSAGPEAIKALLEHMAEPDALDSHPWCHSPLVDELLLRQPELRRASPGRQLLFALAMLFSDIMPSVPPRRGLRLDTQWGEFGILAARYFAPLVYRAARPSTLRDAWGRIDQAILLFVYGQADGSLAAADVERYRLVGNEPDVAPDSTLSDWHRKGLQRMAKAVRERATQLEGAGLGDPEAAAQRAASLARRKKTRRVVLVALAGVLLIGLVLAGFKAYRLYQLAQVVRRDVSRLQAAMPSGMNVDALRRAAGQLQQLDSDLAALETEAAPLLRLAPMFTWVPSYGGDIAQVNELLDFGHHLMASAESAESGLAPLLDASAEDESPSVSDAVAMLAEARPSLAEAQAELAGSMEARKKIDASRLSAGIRQVLENKIDPGMELMQDGLTAALAAPSLMGAGSNGPQTYLLVAQNEDELRPTGGFITAVGKLVVDQGHVVNLSFENSGDVDVWSMPYPMAPWQLSEYMNSSVLILRDTNWFPDYPTAVLYLKQLYAYNHKESVDGVIAFDQQMLIRLLRVLGPIQVQEVSYPVTADNVVEYMRQAKTPPVGETIPEGWTYKAFVGKLAIAVLDKLLSEGMTDWKPLSEAFLQGMQERHLLMQLNDQEITSLLAEHDWDGSLSSAGGDFLTVIDSNVGFTKGNAVIETSLSYDVDLTDLAAPRSSLLVSHVNHATPDVPCIQWNDATEIPQERDYPINRCYWDYMRVYVPAGARISGSEPQVIPDTWMILNKHVEPRVDVLEEEIPGLASFGTLLVVPGGGAVNTSMSFDLPAGTVLTSNPDGSLTYRLHVRKQPGTLAEPITIRLHLPTGSSVESPLPDWVLDGKNVLIETNLKVDVDLEVNFRVP